MIELDANGRIPAVTQARVYLVAGFTDGRPFAGLNHWSDAGPHSQAYIEAYDTFQGWACDTLSASAFVDNHDRPASREHFRVALFQDPHLPERRYTALDVGPVGPGSRDLAREPGFLGWLSATIKTTLVLPVPRILVRHRVEHDGAVVESLVVTTRDDLRAAFGRRVVLGPFAGAASPVTVTLEPAQFVQLSDHPRVVEEMRRFATADGSLCGINPLKA